MNPVQAHINAIGTAVPAHDVHHAFIAWAEEQLPGKREKSVFRRMADRAAIKHRWSVLPPTGEGGSPVSVGGFYGSEKSPSTAARMEIYAEAAPPLAFEAIERLSGKMSIGGVTHLVVASCTGFVAPGIDQIIAAKLGLG
ncbi:MAG: type III polyketide synthase, partial [Gemmatimonadota bacterium]|nr:type III polyketide synthase [Gemmatimonadota bacterium]